MFRFTIKIEKSCSIDKTEEERKEVILKKQITLHNLLRDADALEWALASATDDKFISQQQYDDDLYPLISELSHAIFLLTKNN